MKKIALYMMATLGLVAWACTMDSGVTSDEKNAADFESGSRSDAMIPSGEMDGGFGGEGGEGGQGGESQAEAGVITAAEWNDLVNWSFWGGLMTGDYSKMNGYWGFNTAKRIAVSVSDSQGNPAQGIAVKLLSGTDVCWEAITDNKGEANLWLAVEDVQSTVSAASCQVSVAGQVQASAPEVWGWQAEEPVVNSYTYSGQPMGNSNVDIAFIVDATGSMMDEIDFLKKDLHSILDKVAQMNTDRTIFTGTVFYRDKDGDEYLTRYSPFTTDISSTMAFIGKQTADGGGDTPEAVHTALEEALGQLQWHGNAYCRLAFLVLDAPAHRDHEGVIASLQKSIRSFAAKGIKIIPVFCSSYEKDCEFMCRQFAMLTSGTYVFLTDDSGVGGDHIEATVGDYQVEHLNNLIFRLINKYVE